MHAYEPRPSFDFGNGGQMNMNGGGGPKPYMDIYNPQTNLHHQVGGNKSQQQQAQQGAYSAPYSNGLPLSSQTPYGPHVPAPSGVSAGGVSGTGVGAGQQPGLAQPISASATANAAAGAAGSEDISTIFVVGFPEDMQVSGL